MRKEYIAPLTNITNITIRPVMLDLSAGGDKGGLWEGEVKDDILTDTFDDCTDNDWEWKDNDLWME